MNRFERRAVAKLPVTASPWEIALVDVPAEIGGVDTVGLLVIAEQQTGVVRWAGPLVRGEGLWSLVRFAVHQPSPPLRPARPPRWVCADQALAASVRAELADLGARVEVGPVPAIDEAIASLLEHVEPSAPGITVEQPLWGTTLGLLCRVAPWRDVPDDVTFRFAGPVPELADAVALLLNEDSGPGLALFPTSEDHWRFVQHALGDGPRDDEGIEVRALYLDTADALREDEVDACRAVGLALPGGRYPSLSVARGRRLPLTEREQRVMLAAVEAVTLVCASARGELRERPTTREVRTHLGRLTVTTRPGRPTEPLLVDADYAIGLWGADPEDGRPHPKILLKLRKRDAERVFARIARADGIAVERAGERALVRLFEGDAALGLLHDAPPDWADALANGAALLVAGGGPTRPRIRSQDVVGEVDLLPRGAPKPSGGAGRRHDPVFDGPPSAWPKASETLLRFVEPLLVPGMPVEGVEAALTTASAVWCAVVLADLVGDRSTLDQLRERIRGSGELGPGMIVEALIERKRAAFGGDPRLIVLTGVEQRRTGPHVSAISNIPKGYTLG